MNLANVREAIRFLKECALMNKSLMPIPVEDRNRIQDELATTFAIFEIVEDSLTVTYNQVEQCCGNECLAVAAVLTWLKSILQNYV